MHDPRGLSRIFVHGAGRRGIAAWPSFGEMDGRFVGFAPDSSIEEQVDELLGLLDARVLLFAHSIGAVPAVLAASQRREDIAGLVLVEPALYDIARGRASIERHIGIVTEARSQADAGNLCGFWAILRPLMFGGPFDPTRWDDERPLAERWATTNLPWGHGVRAQMISGIPTRVITGGWNDEYEVIADMLGRAGASPIVLDGAQHRPQDLPDFAAVVHTFEREL
jgi:pimeloyl-ACP methyl ester carboxylesterase